MSKKGIHNIDRACKFKLIYSEQELQILQQTATIQGFTQISKFILFRLSAQTKKLKAAVPAANEKRRYVHVRINNRTVMEVLNAYALVNKIPVAVLIKRLVTDPIILAQHWEGAAEGPHCPLPESP